MSFTRREFLQGSAGALLSAYGLSGARFAWGAPPKGFATTGATDFSRFSLNERNLFFAFNAIGEAEGGESDEFTTIENIERILAELRAPAGTRIIGIGARTGTESNVYGLPGEIGYTWKLGDPWNAKTTSAADGSALPLGKRDPLPVTQVAVLREETARPLEIPAGDLEDRVLWAFQHDDTFRQLYQHGFHNLFADLDDGRVDLLYRAAREAGKRGPGWATDDWKRDLRRVLPRLADEERWARFLEWFPGGFLRERALSEIRREGWEGAAVVLEGRFSNVVQFHLREWVRKTPKEPTFQLRKGTHVPPLNVKVGREVRPYLTAEPADWTMVGFLWDRKNRKSYPSISRWAQAVDLFGEDFHLHGFRNDGTAGGHTLFCTGAGPLKVTLYPLSFVEGKSALVLDNDLAFLPETLRREGDQVVVSLRNDGENFSRNVKVALTAKGKVRQSQSLPVLRPRERREVSFRWEDGLKRPELVIDREGRFLEGGEGTRNNRLDLSEL
jgi:hypothetical protein